MITRNERTRESPYLSCGERTKTVLKRKVF
uniref:Uncharacterized protein n=1 Tax=virus sp. ctLl75 TaxID=2828249 RepID=A0A8S5RAF8_9VIRU|nr:MAG TPA: hypothetical protein [virus sp. ctLl75]